MAQLGTGGENLAGGGVSSHGDIHGTAQAVADGEAGHGPDDFTRGGVLTAAVTDAVHGDTGRQRGA